MSIIGFNLETIEILPKISVANFDISSLEKYLKKLVTLTLIECFPKFFGWTLQLPDLSFEVLHCRFQYQEFE